MKNILRITWRIIVLIASGVTSLNGIHEFDNATSWIQIFRGLLWAVAGQFVFWTALYKWREERKK